MTPTTMVSIDKVLNNAAKVDVVAVMTEFLDGNAGFAKQVVKLLNRYFSFWAGDFVEFDDDLNPYINDDPKDVDRIFYENRDDWSFMLSEDAENDDWTYTIYYKMVDFRCGQIKDFSPNIIEKYLRTKLNLGC